MDPCPWLALIAVCVLGLGMAALCEDDDECDPACTEANRGQVAPRCRPGECGAMVPGGKDQCSCLVEGKSHVSSV